MIFDLNIYSGKEKSLIQKKHIVDSVFLKKVSETKEIHFLRFSYSNIMNFKAFLIFKNKVQKICFIFVGRLESEFSIFCICIFRSSNSEGCWLWSIWVIQGWVCVDFYMLLLNLCKFTYLILPYLHRAKLIKKVLLTTATKFFLARLGFT